ncbi:hypothetical protein [uncultured Hymenobacter sp.]|uniref:hypothetical protein n=1 Tax=uncultured Hymenobacter sp. TaxID=170016 RepID=UPI0035CBA496
MKARNLLALLALILFLTNCEDSQNYQPLRKIDGTWKITRLHYVDTETGSDSVVTEPAATFLVFSACSKNQNKQPSNCKLTYQTPEASLPFTFQVTGNESVAINGDRYTGPLQKQFRDAETVLAGSYQIVQLDDENLRLTGDKGCGGIPEKCRYHIEIDAVAE